MNKKIKLHHWTVIYCIAAFVLQLTPFHNTWIFFSTMPVGLIGAIVSGIRKDLKFLYFNLIGMLTMFLAMFFGYVLEAIWVSLFGR